MTKLEKRLRQSRRMLTRESLALFGQGTFDGYRLIADDGKWCLEMIDEHGCGIFHMTG